MPLLRAGRLTSSTIATWMLGRAATEASRASSSTLLTTCRTTFSNTVLGSFQEMGILALVFLPVRCLPFASRLTLLLLAPGVRVSDLFPSFAHSFEIAPRHGSATFRPVRVPGRLALVFAQSANTHAALLVLVRTGAVLVATVSLAQWVGPPSSNGLTRSTACSTGDVAIYGGLAPAIHCGRGVDFRNTTLVCERTGNLLASVSSLTAGHALTSFVGYRLVNGLLIDLRGRLPSAPSLRAVERRNGFEAASLSERTLRPLLRKDQRVWLIGNGQPTERTTPRLARSCPHWARAARPGALSMPPFVDAELLERAFRTGRKSLPISSRLDSRCALRVFFVDGECYESRSRSLAAAPRRHAPDRTLADHVLVD